MESKIALVGIIVEDSEAAQRVNSLLHEYREYIVGRMGLPYHKKELNIISVVLDAQESQISALAGKLGMVDGISVKTVYAKIAPDK